MPHPSLTAQKYPRKPAYIMGSSGEVVTYQQLDERSNQAAHLFRSMGLRAGDHIAIMMENNREFLELIWGAQRSGLIFTPISTHLSTHEAVYILRNCGAKLFIGSIELAEAAEKVLCEASSVVHYLMVGGIRAGFHSWDTAVAKQPKYPIEDESCGTPMLYSSGTTGQPKGVHVPAYGECVNTPPALVPYLADTFEFDASTVYLSTAPLYHAAPLHYSMMTLYQAGTIVLMEKYGSERALKLIERHRVTHSQWVPIMFIRMLKLPRVLRESYDTTSMRMAIHAAAPCPIEVKEKMIDWWGETLMEYYSSNEGIGVSIINSNDWLTHRGSVGQPLVGDLYILNEKGEELRPGQTGAIYFGGEHVRFNYHREPAMTQAAYDKRGRATSGDLGYVDEDGFLYLTGRQSFTITSSGISIHPQEVENILANHDKVADVAVFGIPHAEHGEEVKAVIEPVSWDNATEETAAEILQWLGRQISNAKIPNSLDFHPKLPRMDNGKLYKQSLMDQYSR